METLIKILIVEDEMIIGAKISMQLTTLGYDVTAILPRGEEAVVHIGENRPDIVLMDIRLKGNLDGIETALQIQKIADIPIIYLTANYYDDAADIARGCPALRFGSVVEVRMALPTPTV